MRYAWQRVLRNAAWSLIPPTMGGEMPDVEPTDLPKVADDDDLDRVLRDYLNVKLPRTQCCEHHRTPWEAVHDAFFARSAVSVWKASRGFGGKSFTMAALGLAEALFLRADVNILGGTGEQSKRVLEAITKLWEVPSSPKVCLIGEPGSQKQKLVWGNRIVALMASQASVRGPHPQRLRLDEVDEMKLTILDSALGQPMSKGWILSQVVLSSTHQYADGTMTEILKRSAAQDWPVFEWCYRENLEPHGWLSMAEVERKRAILTAAMWDTEVELQEPSSEGRAMNTDKVEAAFSPLITLEDPVDGATYATGADWAKKKNHTVITTIRTDVRPMRVVAVTRTQREPWPSMVGYFDHHVTRYPGPACHDNTGLGQVVDDLLTVPAEAFNMVGRQRSDLLSNYAKAIESGDCLWPRDDTKAELAAAYSEHKYATQDDLYRGGKDGSSKFHLPDTISSGALAWRAADVKPAASAVRQPDPDDHSHLQRGIQRGRLSSYMRGRTKLAGQDDDDDDDTME